MSYRLAVIAFCSWDASEARRHLSGADEVPEAESLIHAMNAVNECESILIPLNSGNESEVIAELNNTINAFCPSSSHLAQRVPYQIARLLHRDHMYDDALATLSTIASPFRTDRDFVAEQASIELDMYHYDTAIRLYELAGDSAGIDRAKLMKRRSYYVNWYAFLGLDRDKGASFEEIRSAYRRIVRVWHPDRFHTTSERSEAERLMKRINSAYDILMNPRLKQAYDQGLDPYDPEAKRPREFSSEIEEFFTKHNIEPEMPKEGPLRISVQI
jgi:hypothetical protein